MAAPGLMLCAVSAALLMGVIGLPMQEVEQSGRESAKLSSVNPPWAVAETARWMVHENDWGYLTTGPPLRAELLSFSDGPSGKSSGRLWFYLMGGLPTSLESSFTLSQAALGDFSCDNTDPEDPRCTKLTITGMLVKSPEKDIATGKKALFARHPQMKDWPTSHGFTVYELKVSKMWMIDFFGGGLTVSLWRYHFAKPKHNAPKLPTKAMSGDLVVIPKESTMKTSPPPPHDQPAARARWIMYHAVWASIGSISVHLNGKPWGNIRSIADGMGKNSSGLPTFYLPTPDPTAIDLKTNPQMSLIVSEASLKERVDPATGSVCEGKDPMDPTCGRLALYGTLRELSDADEIAQARVDLGVRHPLAPWLANGGAHTGGKYCTIQVSSILLLDYFGGYTKVELKDYLAVPTPSVEGS